MNEIASIGNKIVIIGSPGAGKSTFARALGDILHIEVFHLDRYFWERGWKEYSRQKRRAIEQALVSGHDRWIIEGTYLGSSDSRLNAANTIIFLDMPRLLCLRQAVKRHVTFMGRSRPDIPDGCTDKLGFLYILKILVFPHRGRRELLTKIKEIRAYKENASEKKHIFIIRSHTESEAFLSDIASQQQSEHSHHQEIYATPWPGFFPTYFSLTGK